MSLTLSPFVVVYQIRAYAVIPHRERVREEGERGQECDRAREGSVEGSYFLLFRGLFICKSGFVNKMLSIMASKVLKGAGGVGGGWQAGLTRITRLTGH